MARPRKDSLDESINEITLTPEQRALSDRLSSDDKSWQTITEGDIVDFSLAEDQYKLPKEALEKQNRREFAFRWVEATPQRVDQIKSMDPPAKWWPCNSTNTPFLSKYVDPIHGGIQRHDQVLMFKPWWMHQAYQAAKMRIAEGKANAGDLDKRNGIKDEFGEWKSGDPARVTSNDEVMAEDTEEYGDSSGVEDLE